MRVSQPGDEPLPKGVDGKHLVDMGTAFFSIDLIDFVQCLNGFIDGLGCHQNPVLPSSINSPLAPRSYRDYRRAASHRFNGDKTKGLLPFLGL